MPNKYVAIASALIGAIEVVLSAMYNFHEPGVVLGTFCVLLGLAVYFLLRPEKKQRRELMKEMKKWLSRRESTATRSSSINHRL